ncbi:MAG: hypothetical protein ACRD8Z_16065 [Nitrososphaeraceae archaeon]
MNQTQQIQDKKHDRKIQKGLLIAKAHRVRHSDVNRKVWLVGSGNPKTPKRFYCVVWDEKLEAFMCDCPDFRYNCVIGDLCAHIIAAGFHEGGLNS